MIIKRPLSELLQFNTIMAKSIIAGILIGVGNVINLTVENHYIGAFLFSLGLLSIIHCGLFLYTGRIGFITNYSIKFLVFTFLGNIIGISIVSGLIRVANLPICETLFNHTKFQKSYLQMFILAIFCGICMQIAVACKNQLITVLCIMVFILAGFEHCIADFMYLIFANGNALELLGKFALAVLGNSIGSIGVYILMNPTDWLKQDKIM